MYNKKSSGPKIEPWGTPHLIDFSLRNFLCYLFKVYISNQAFGRCFYLTLPFFFVCEKSIFG